VALGQVPGGAVAQAVSMALAMAVRPGNPAVEVHLAAHPLEGVHAAEAAAGAAVVEGAGEP
jgi:hypothetical protein